MRRTMLACSILCGLTLVLAAAGCGGEVEGAVLAQNDRTGELRTFSSENDVPPGWTQVEPFASAKSCLADKECGAGQACFFAFKCQGQGTCKDKPQLCTQEYSPVCGCDGKDYSNECAATSAGISVAFTGPCHVTPADPAKPCTSDKDCAANERCDIRPGMPAGTCFDKTPWTPKTCKIDSECAANERCALTAGSSLGTCESKGCICTMEVAPVCGVDRKTYGNACEAKCAGVTIAHPGAC